MNRPIPTAPASLITSGTASHQHLAPFSVTVSRTKMMPAQKTSPRARRPGHPRPEADAVGEEGVHPHPRRQGDRIVGHEGHEQRREGRGEGGGHDRPLLPASPPR